MSKIPATVITGFLGAGKTTLIRHLISNAQGRRIALIVNEFGDVGVDGELLKGCGVESCSDDDIIELANGCICCTVADDFVPTMEKLLDRPNPPDHIVIETSGLALPQPLVRAFRWPEVKTRVTVDGVITVIDAAAVAAGRFAEDEAALAAQRQADPALDHDQPIAELFEDQIGCADLIILNKTDLVDADTLTQVEAQVRAEARPAAGVVHADHGKLPASVLLGLTSATEGDIDNRPSHHDLEGEEHDHEDFESFVVETGAQSDQGLAARIATIMAEHDILRLKGFVAVPGKDMRLVVQAVGPRVESFFDRAWTAGETRATRLVVIGEKGLDQAAITQALAA